MKQFKLKARYFLPLFITFFLASSALAGLFYYQNFSQGGILNRQAKELQELKIELENTKSALTELENQDQVKKNKELQEEINNIRNTFSTASKTYEDLVDLQESKVNITKLTPIFAKILNQLASRNYQEAAKSITTLQAEIVKLTPIATAPATINPSTVPANNTPPSSGYSRQTVSSPVGSFVVSLVAADLGSTKVIVDTASDSDCKDNCPVLPLGTYVSRSGAYAGINGTYFCPASYPSCAGKTNSFDLLVMNKNKVYLNSDNNVYSNNPAAIFSPGSIRFVGAASQWGRDTSVDGVVSNYPLLVSGSQVNYTGDADPKSAVRGGRSFVANKGSQVFIGVVHSASLTEAANVLKTLGMENALNLDNGGSTALWSGGYKAGPGRDLPNAILFIRR